MVDQPNPEPEYKVTNPEVAKEVAERNRHALEILDAQVTGKDKPDIDEKTATEEIERFYKI